MEGISIADTFGVMLIGAFIAMGIYGITTLQTYFYYMYYPKDEISIKWLVGVIWILDTLHIILMCHAVHYYLVRGFSQTELLSDGVPICDRRNQCAGRVYFAKLLHNANTQAQSRATQVVDIGIDRKPGTLFTQCPKLTSFDKGIIVLAHLCFGMETVIFFFIKKQFIRLKDISLIAATPFGITAILSDIVIALALCILLHSNKSEFEDTNHIINKLIVYAINRCLLTSVIAVIEVVLFGVIPNPFYTFGIDFVIGKFYANSLLAALNSRGSIRTTLVECNSTELSTNFVATGVETEHDPTAMHVRNREYAPDHRLENVDLEMEGEGRQSGMGSTMHKTRQPWS
ncbi:hypothetical protein D9756_003383 [Leucocoprinus leucothites]|uniref:DUF6534 domain-containing protein n=1 Tax=Leucocoprinus leucothites TaxID=201217 RepID=A0A8H5G752_9AGAR|nr:hypothetical protein D9756_003383 [Leucoagaricus leucothites]